LQVTQHVNDYTLIKVVVVPNETTWSTLLKGKRKRKTCHKAERDVNNEEPQQFISSSVLQHINNERVL
jgi:hypothetical protein